MPYSAEISRRQPACILFLIDQSHSMSDAWSSRGTSKAEGLATIVNKALSNITIESAKGEGINDYFHVGVIGYGSSVGSAYIGPLAGEDLVPISRVANEPARVEERQQKIDDGAGGLIEQTVKFPVWFDAVAQNGTPMCEALRKAESVISAWAASNSESFPPIVINITDGEANDGDPVGPAEAVRAVSTDDGDALLFNLHLSANTGGRVIIFPDDPSELPDDYARQLFEMSSVLPTEMREAAQKATRYTVTDKTRGFAYQADSASVIEFLDIGTRPSNLR